MSITILVLSGGDVSYIAKHNANYAAIKAAVESLQESLGASLGAALSTAEGFQALFGSSIALVGSGSYLCHGAAAILTVDAGFCWLPASSLMVEHSSSSTLDFTGLAAATYYVVVDESGAASRSASSTDAIYSVVWTGVAFGAITRVANLVWAAADWVAAQTSTALATSYETLDARLEAGETITKANQTAITTYGDVVTLNKDTDGTLAANSDTRVATQKAVKTYVDANIGGLTNAMVFKGNIDCSANPNYPAADAGDVYRVSVAGKIGGAAGPDVNVGDTCYCITDGTAAGTHAAVGANWNIANENVTLESHGALINSATSKATPVDADYLGLMDSAAANVLKKLSWSNLKATLKTYFDTLYRAAAPSIATPAYAATLALDLSTVADGGTFRVGTLTGNITLQLSNGTDGQRFSIEVVQDATGSRTVTLDGTYFRFGTDIASFTATTTVSKRDIIGCVYRSATTKADVVATVKGF